MGVLKKVGIGIGIAVGVLIAIVMAASVMVVQNMQEQEKPVLEPTIGSQEATKELEQMQETNEFSIGETVVVAGIAFKVTGIETSQGTSLAEPDGLFVIVDLEIENLRKETTQLYSDQFTLIDSENRHFESTLEIFLEEKQIIADDIQPNLPTKRSVVFDVPFNSDLEYKLLIEPQTFSLSSDEATIKLGMGTNFKNQT